MPTYETEIFFPYDAKDVFAMVEDIESYPLFLPNCDYLKIISDVAHGDERKINAEMGVKYKIFSEKFRSDVSINNGANEITVQLASGPIKKMSNVWRFCDHLNGCNAHFYIQVEMKNLPLRLALAAAFKIGIREITEAFLNRADVLYGK